MKNQSILSIVKNVELSTTDMYTLVESYGLERAVEIQAKYSLYLAITESESDFVRSKDVHSLVNVMYTLHKKQFTAQVIEAFKKEYK